MDKDSTANVTSIAAVRDLRTALVKFQDEARQAITILSMEVRRAVQWFEVDRAQYWPMQLRLAGEKLTQTRNDLERCQLKYGSEDAPPCYEQKKAVQGAKRRVQLCDEKLRATKKWILSIRQEINEFSGQVAKMNNCLDSDIPRAIAALDRMVNALEKYAVVPATQSTEETKASAEGADKQSERERDRETKGDE